MQGLGLYWYGETKEWVCGYFRNNNMAKEFEKGSLKAHQKSLPSFSGLEKIYGKMIDRLDYDNDISQINNTITMSEEKKKKASGSPDKRDALSKSENKKEVLRFTIDENIKKQHPPPGDNYCNIF